MATTLTEKSSTGLDANIAGALSYLFVPAIVFLAIEKDSQFVRFHAFQGLFLGLASIASVIAINILWLLPVLGWFALALYPLSALLFFVAWLISTIKAFQGERFKLPVLGDLAEQQVSK